MDLKVKKGSIEYYQEKTDAAIAQLVFDKIDQLKAYNYYHGYRDAAQFKHLEDNYGLGSPTSITFIPLIRKHIDAIIGEYLSNDIKPKISCKDKATIENIHREQELKIYKGLIDKVKENLSKSIFDSVLAQQGGEQQKQKAEDPVIKQEYADIERNMKRNFISNYEVAAQNIINYLLNSRDVDFKTKIKLLLTDLLSIGELYYKVEASIDGTNVNIRVLNPLNVFPEKNPKSEYIKDSYRCVVREFMTKEEIISKYGKYLSESDIDDLDSSIGSSYNNSDLVMINSLTTRGCFVDSGDAGIFGNVGAIPLYNSNRTNSAYGRQQLHLYPVYEVEWIDYEKVDDDYINNRYSCVRIGSDIYIHEEKNKHLTRDQDNSTVATLSVNGMWYSDRSGIPYSLIGATMNLQDQYDILHFFKNNVIANSGTVGDWVDVAMLPSFLGSDVKNRLIKWIAYKKQGLALIDTSQDGQQLNTTFNGYDDSVNLNAIQAINLAIEQLENTASSITGVFRERLGGIEQRDAVANVNMGMQQSYIINKQYTLMIDTVVREMLLDSINLAKVVFKKGFTGTYILGNTVKTFTALPEHYTISDFDIHVITGNDLNKDKELIKNLSMNLSQGGQVDPELLVHIISSESITDMKESVLESLKQKKEENNMIAQLQQQIEEASKQLKQMEQQLTQSTNKLNSMNEEKMKWEKEKFEKEYQLKQYIAKEEAEYKDGLLGFQRDRVKLEGLQLIDSNPNNDEIRNN